MYKSPLVSDLVNSQGLAGLHTEKIGRGRAKAKFEKWGARSQEIFVFRDCRISNLVQELRCHSGGSRGGSLGSIEPPFQTEVIEWEAEATS